MSDETKKRKRGALLRATATAGIATAVLMGGFGGFSLWSDTFSAGTTQEIATGTLDIVGVTGESWTFQGSPDDVLTSGDTIDPATFKASPGDILEYDATVQVNVDGTDMKAQLLVDPTSIVIDPTLATYVDVSTQALPVTGMSGVQSIPVKVTVEFDDAIPDQVGQTLPNAVSLSGLAFDLIQIH